MAPPRNSQNMNNMLSYWSKCLYLGNDYISEHAWFRILALLILALLLIFGSPLWQTYRIFTNVKQIKYIGRVWNSSEHTFYYILWRASGQYKVTEMSSSEGFWQIMHYMHITHSQISYWQPMFTCCQYICHMYVAHISSEVFRTTHFWQPILPACPLQDILEWVFRKIASPSIIFL